MTLALAVTFSIIQISSSITNRPSNIRFFYSEKNWLRGIGIDGLYFLLLWTVNLLLLQRDIKRNFRGRTRKEGRKKITSISWSYYWQSKHSWLTFMFYSIPALVLKWPYISCLEGRLGRDVLYSKLYPLLLSIPLVLKAVWYSDLQCIYKAFVMYGIQAIYKCPMMFHSLAITGYIK